MLGNYSQYIEMGGQMGISYAQRSDQQNGQYIEDDNDVEYQLRKKLYGINKQEQKKKSNIWYHFYNALKDPITQQQLIAAILSIGLNSINDPKQGWVDGISMQLVVFIVQIITGQNTYRQEMTFSKISKLVEKQQVNVVRGSIIKSIEQEDLVVGDVIVLNPGTIIPADGILVDRASIKVNESSLTGETDEVIKDTYAPFLYSGTEIREGSCRMLVTCVGKYSTKGTLLTSMINYIDEPTLLQKRFKSLTIWIGIIASIFMIVLFIILITRYIINILKDKNKINIDNILNEIIKDIILCITQLILAFPEGLPVAITISLTFAITRMRDSNCLVKILGSCEAMGSITDICTDKTGTLTQNSMKVIKLIYNTNCIDVTNATIIPKIYYEHYNYGIVCNSTRRLNSYDINKEPEKWEWEGDGGSTETALLSMIARYTKKDFYNIRNKLSNNILYYKPFSSKDKFSYVIIYDSTSNNFNNCRRYYKGSAEILLSHCSYILIEDGTKVELNTEILKKCQINKCNKIAMRGNTNDGILTHCELHSDNTFLQNNVCRYDNCTNWALYDDTEEPKYCQFHIPKTAVNIKLDINSKNIMTKLLINMERNGLRCITLAYQDNLSIKLENDTIPNDIYFLNEEDMPNDLILISIFGIQDPLRYESKYSVYCMQNAGIVLRMITGDSIDTATYISKDCGIVTNPKHLIVDGKTFRQRYEENIEYYNKYNKHDIEFIEFIKSLRVIARCQPSDKVLLVGFLRKEMNSIVCVTGDGSNDGPALRIATVGLAMGISGTDVAKYAADIILLDDNFISLVRAVMWGRYILDNIQKFCQFQLTIACTTLTTIFVSVIVYNEIPFYAVQLLYTNIIIDTLVAIFLSTDKPDPEVLQHKPYRSTILLTTFTLRNIIGQSIFQLIILITLLILFYGNTDIGNNICTKLNLYTIDIKNTFLFNTFICLQLFNEINSRIVNNSYNIQKGLFSNRYACTILSFTIIIHFLIIQFFGTLAHTTGLSAIAWIVSISIGFTQILTCLFIKLLFPIDVHKLEIHIDKDDAFEGAPWQRDPSLLQKSLELLRSDAKSVL